MRRPKALLSALICSCLLVGALWMIYYRGDNKTSRCLRLQNYSGYYPQELIDKFEDETGIKVKYSITDDSSGPEFQLLQESCDQDVVLLSLTEARRLHALGAVQAIPKWAMRQVPYHLPAGLFVSAGDYLCVPHLAGTVSIAYNHEKVLHALQDIPDNPLDLVFDAGIVARLKSKKVRMTLVDSPVEVLAVLMQWNGAFPNNTDLDYEDTRTAQQALLDLRYAYDEINTLLYIQRIQKQCTDVVLGWSLFLRQAVKNNPSFVLSHCNIGWVDVWCVPVNANSEYAFKFIEFATRPEHAEIVRLKYQGSIHCAGVVYPVYNAKTNKNIQRHWRLFKAGTYLQRD